MLLFSIVLSGCLEPPPSSSGPPVPAAKRPAAKPMAPEVAPEVELSLPTREVRSPAAEPADDALRGARTVLEWVVRTYARDPDDPWAMGHALLALGPDSTTIDGKKIVPWLFEEYAQRRQVGRVPLVDFPRARGNIRIEPHSDLVLKALMEVGVSPDKHFVVEGRPATLLDLYRHSLWAAWVDEQGRTGFDGLHDAPWALQGLATGAPPGLRWTAKGGRPMDMDRFTDVLARDLAEQTAFMKEAMAEGRTVEKRRQGIFAYTCGGQHTIQGVGYAVARGFGSSASRAEMVEQVEVLYWRVGVELAIYDRLLREEPDYELILLEQRLKFLGHFLETAHKLAALGLYQPTEAQRETLQHAREQLVVTVGLLDRGEVFKQLTEMRADPSTYQMYLDFVGDSAHALRGIDLSTGEGTVRY